MSEKRSEISRDVSFQKNTEYSKSSSSLQKFKDPEYVLNTSNAFPRFGQEKRWIPIDLLLNILAYKFAVLFSSS